MQVPEVFIVFLIMIFSMVESDRHLLGEEIIDVDDYQLQMNTAKASPSKSQKRDGKSGGGGGKGERAGKWKENFALLTKYKESNGHTLIPLTYEEGDVKLGRWLRAIQKAWVNKKLPQEKIDALANLGVMKDPSENKDFAINEKEAKVVRKEDKFDQYAAAMVQYKKDKGTLEIKRNYVTPEGLKLGMWLSSILVKAKKGTLEELKVKEMRKLYAQLGLDFDETNDSFKRPIKRVSSR